MKLTKEMKLYFAEIGRKGGKKSKRSISPEQQKSMQKARRKAKKDKTS